MKHDSIYQCSEFQKNVEIKYFSKIFESIELMNNRTNEWIDLRKSSF